MPLSPRTPLAELVVGRTQALGVGRVELMRLLGFANTNRGLRKFDDYLTTGQPTSHLMAQLPDVLGIEPAHFADPVEATRRAIADAAEAKARARFVPHVLVETQTPPGVSIPGFYQMFIWHQKVLGLPEAFSQKDVSRQLRYVARLLRAHFHHYAEQLGSWGRIVRYRLQRTYDHAVLLRVDGTIEGVFIREPLPPAPCLQVKGKTMPMGMFGQG